MIERRHWHHRSSQVHGFYIDEIVLQRMGTEVIRTLNEQALYARCRAVVNNLSLILNKFSRLISSPAAVTDVLTSVNPYHTISSPTIATRTHNKASTRDKHSSFIQ